MKGFIKLFGKLDSKHHQSALFSDFLQLTADGLANTCDFRKSEVREKRYQQIRQKYRYEDMQIFSECFAYLMAKCNEAMESRNLKDFFNQLFMEGFANGEKGQFFTPFSLSQFMTQVSIDIQQPIIKQTEMSVGSGGMIIATADRLMKENVDYQHRLIVECGDIDLRCVQMAYIQLFLYGIPARVIHKNALDLAAIPYEEYCTLGYLNYLIQKRGGKNEN